MSSESEESATLSPQEEEGAQAASISNILADRLKAWIDWLVFLDRRERVESLKRSQYSSRRHKVVN